MPEQKQNPGSAPPMNFKIFDLYDISEIKVEDPGLKNVINLQPKLALKSYGRNSQKFGQIKVNVVERLINKTNWGESIDPSLRRNIAIFVSALLNKEKLRDLNQIPCVLNEDSVRRLTRGFLIV